MTTVRAALSDSRRHRVRAADTPVRQRHYASRRRLVRDHLHEEVVSVLVLVAVLAITLVLLGLQWLQSSPTSASPAPTTPPALTTTGGSP
ncbi:MAG: hypothetical protein J2P57_20445 [Acidimicrobiaceae bacterium]|nr:hypothetical protein [Acidimicrobiaceae bacterium]